MSDPRRRHAGASEPFTPDAPVPSARWTIAVEDAVRPGLRNGRPRNPRQRILDALVQTVALRGYDRTTVEQVSRLAGVPKPVFEEHFEGKQDCLLAALDELIGGLKRIVLERVAGQALWSERVRLGLQTLLAALACHPDGARVALVEYLSAGEPAVARMRSAAASFVPALEQGRARAGYTGHLPPQASEAVVGGIAAILHRHVLEGHTAELPALLPDLLYFALMPYVGHERALDAAGADSSAAA
ncbi:MAG TPA: TetR/AcrR family transcriptional regulator [Solirubrobacteraceae bacterium]|nr:TetR/AcrR family transcriptional regulator [Solirubrobacteraceae bacterium]